MRRGVVFTSKHDALRARVGEFLDREIVPQYASWESDGFIPRELWRKAGTEGLLCRGIPTEYGGVNGDFLESVVIIEEVSKRRLMGFMTYLQSDISVPYIAQLGTEDQKQKYLPLCISGECLVAIAITEPHSGSDLCDIRTTATRTTGGYVLDGEKVHISNGTCGDLLIVAARTSPVFDGGRAGLSLFLVEGNAAGLQRTPLRKAGMRALDTGHLTFDRCHVPSNNLLGAEGMGFVYLMRLLALERLAIAIGAQATCVSVLRDLISHCSQRRTVHGSLLDHQNTRFTIADLLSETMVNQAFVDQCIAMYNGGESDSSAFCIAKLQTTELLKRMALQAVQLRGARGLSTEAGDRTSQDLLDACVQTLWGGASEVMRDIIGSRGRLWT
jgi:acyl-CoA dehydrogenase